LPSNSHTVLNRVLLALPPAVREDVLNQCERVELTPGQTLYAATEPIHSAYFVNRGLVSLIKVMENGVSAEVAAIGCEGLVGLFASMHTAERAFADHVVELPTEAFRIASKKLASLIEKHDILRRAITRSVLLAAEQLIQVSACNRLHSLKQRCSHWLLVAADAANSNEFQLTHEFLSSLLGAERSSVSTTMSGLQRRGLIRNSRGRISLLDRPALSTASCECYGARAIQIEHAFGARMPTRESVVALGWAPPHPAKRANDKPPAP
jgi:CRP-like cAMP-binding protein